MVNDAKMNLMLFRRFKAKLSIQNIGLLNCFQWKSFKFVLIKFIMK